MRTTLVLIPLSRQRNLDPLQQPGFAQVAGGQTRRLEDKEMNINRSIRYRITLLAAAVLAIAISSSQLKADTGMCGGASTTLPFTDVLGGNIFFCSIAEAYFSALTNGTDAAHYSP